MRYLLVVFGTDVPSRLSLATTDKFTGDRINSVTPQTRACCSLYTKDRYNKLFHFDFATLWLFLSFKYRQGISFLFLTSVSLDVSLYLFFFCFSSINPFNHDDDEIGLFLFVGNALEMKKNGGLMIFKLERFSESIGLIQKLNESGNHKIIIDTHRFTGHCGVTYDRFHNERA